MQRRAPPTCRSRVTWREKLKEARSPHYFSVGRAIRGRPSRRTGPVVLRSAAASGLPTYQPLAPAQHAGLSKL